MKHLKSVLFLFTIVTAKARVENDLILDYFRYKMVTSVVGFSCNLYHDDLSLFKRFSNIGIFLSVSKKNYTMHQIHRFAFTSYRKLGIFLDLRCHDKISSSSILVEAANHRLYDEIHQWLLLGSEIGELTSIVDDRAFTLSTDFVIGVTSSNKSSKCCYDLYDVYNPWWERGTKLIVTPLGSWKRFGELKISLVGSKFIRRSNLQGLTVRSSFLTSTDKPASISLEDYMAEFSITGRDVLSKFGFIVVTHLSEMFNFTLKFGTVPPRKVGDRLNPIVRALANDEMDLSGSPTIMNVERTYLVNFVHQSWPFRTCFLFRSPQPKNVKFTDILRPLVIKVWFIITGFFVIFLWIMATTLRHEYADGAIKRFSNSMLVTLGAICQQGTDIKIIRASTRIVFLVILVFSFLLYNYYSASVVSVRLSKPILKINDSLIQLAQSDLKLASEWMVYFDFFMKRDDLETKILYTTRWKKIPEDEQFIEPNVGMRLVQKGVFAYHTHPEIAYPYIHRLFDNRETCELTEVHLVQPTMATFACTRNSTFVEMMRIGLMRISEVGLRQRQLKRWSCRKPYCIKTIRSATSIKINEFAPHLFILICGMMLSCTVYGVENAKIFQEVLKESKLFVRRNTTNLTKVVRILVWKKPKKTIVTSKVNTWTV